MDYDRLKRDPKSDKFYHSPEWKRCRATKTAVTPWCEFTPPGATEPCGQPVEHVHHVQPISTPEGWERRLDQTGLMSVCISHHNVLEAAGPPMPTAASQLAIVEDDEFYFDADAADRPCRFIERFCKHTEGKFAGQPFKLLPWQRDLVVRPLFGWKRRDTGLRRFKELYLLSGKGCGKTPLLSSLILHLLLADGEASPHCISMASTFEQANLTFANGKAFIRESPELAPHCEVVQYAIRTRGGGKWTTVSGKPNGRSGPRPSAIVGDEVHEWAEGTGEGFDLLCANLFKRSQPMLLVATNAAASRQSFAGRMHERALAVLSGKIRDETLLPVIFEAPADLPWDSEAAARAANPSLGQIVHFSQLQPAIERARLNPVAKAQYERLYLSRWVAGSATRWIDIPNRWTPNVKTFDPAKLDNPAIYIGLDLSEGDDLCAAVFIYCTPTQMYVTCRFWLPKATADEYERKNGIPFTEWAAAGHITLLDEPTIGPDVRRRIASEIAATGKITAVCYDRYRADEAVATLTAAGVKTMPIAQGYTLSPGVAELDRRLIERTITIAPNPVLDWNATNVELKADDRGNQWPVKPNAKRTYAGSRALKVDGVVALVTALTEARKHSWPDTKPKWSGVVMTIGG